MNRSHDYGTTIDNELRTLDHIGLFGSTFPTAKLDQIARLPTPNDPGFVLEQGAPSTPIARTAIALRVSVRKSIFASMARVSSPRHRS